MVFLYVHQSIYLSRWSDFRIKMLIIERYISVCIDIGCFLNTNVISFLEKKIEVFKFRRKLGLDNLNKCLRGSVDDQAQF